MYTYLNIENTFQYLLGVDIIEVCSQYPVNSDIEPVLKPIIQTFWICRMGLKIINVSFPILNELLGKYQFSAPICFIFFALVFILLK